MPNPRYAPQPQRVSSRDRKAELLASMQEGDQRQQQIDQQGQAQMLAQLTALYGLGQQAQMSPLQIQAMQADLEAKGLDASGKQFDLDNAPVLLQSKLDTDMAQRDAATAQANRYSRPELPNEFAYLPSDAQQVVLDQVYPELRINREKAAAQKTQANWQGIEANARQYGVNPDDVGNITNQFGPENLQWLQSLKVSQPIPEQTAPSNAGELGKKAGDAINYGLGRGVMNLPAAVYNTLASGSDFLGNMFGIPLQAQRMLGPGDIYYDYLMQGKPAPNSLLVSPKRNKK